ncbi:transposase family protein, partial [Nitrosomonas sp.]|uniref:transposase family protein n=1 Tax=Nitrosomonas sp. TaxID=42353 RepID=UPI00374CE5F7
MIEKPIEMIEKPIASIIHHFSSIEDPGVGRQKKHQLQDIFFIALCAVICGANNWVAIEETESWFNSFKNERVHGLRYETRAAMATMSFEYIEVLYNRKRQHSTVGYKSPMRFLNDWLIT